MGPPTRLQDSGILCYSHYMQLGAMTFWTLIIAVTATGAEYIFKPVKVLPIESYPARMTLGQVTVAADCPNNACPNPTVTNDILVLLFLLNIV